MTNIFYKALFFFSNLCRPIQKVTAPVRPLPLFYISFIIKLETVCNIFLFFPMSEILEKLFHSKAEVKIIRLFLNNEEEKYLLSEIAEKTKTDTATIRKEMANLEKAGFVAVAKKNQKTYYNLNIRFVFLDELKRLFFKATPSSSDKIKSRIEKIGNLKLVLISGALINSDKGRVDILIVGDTINRSKLLDFLSDLESEVGRGLRYVYMNNDEYKYRKNMFDKFIIDIIESPHKVLINNMTSDGSI